MSPEEVHLRHCLLYEFERGTKACDAFKNISIVYPNSGLTLSKTYKWYLKFKHGDFELSETRGGSESKFDNSTLLEMVEQDPRLTSREIAQYFDVSHSTVTVHLGQIGKICRQGSWIPHDLSQKNKNSRVEICSYLLNRLTLSNFLTKIITVDEKWILYNNVKMKKQWLSKKQKPDPTPKDGLHPRKIMLSVWWDCRGLIYYELLPHGKTITANYYCDQLLRVEEKLRILRPALINRKNILYLHDNAKPHISTITKNLLNALEWESLPHPAYSPNISPSDYHLFRSLQNYLDHREFLEIGDVENSLKDYFNSKDEIFYKKGIMDLPSRWERVINSDGNYFD